MKKTIDNIILFIRNHPFTIPALLILVATIISGFYQEAISPLSIYFNYFIMFSIISFLLYQILYYWRHLPLSASSFICFSIIFLQLVFYVLASYNIIFNLDHPIFLNDLSIFSQARYLVLTIISVFFILGFFITKAFSINLSNFSNYIVFFTFPYLKEQVRIFLDSVPAIYNISILALNYLLNPFSKARYILLILDSLSLLFRLLILALFFSFCFFNLDLRFLLYLIPLRFLFWILSFFIYYIIWIIQANSTGFREMLELSPSNSELLPVGKLSFNFKITSEAIKEGFTENDLSFLVNKWVTLADLSNFLSYRNYLKYLSFGIIPSYLICWFYITYYFFYADSTELLLVNPFQGFANIFRRTLIWHPPMRYPRDLRGAYEHRQNDIKLASNGEFAVGHMLIGELLPDGSYRIDGFATKGPYGTTIMSSPIMQGVQGGSQQMVRFSKPLFVSASWVKPPIPGSDIKLENPLVKAIIEHYLKNK